MLAIDQRTAVAVGPNQPRPGNTVLTRGSRCQTLIDELLAGGAA